MDFSLSEDQTALQQLAREILAGESTHERLKEVEAGEERIDRALWRELAKANLLGVAIDEAHGGSGLGLTELCLLLEEVGRAVAAVPVVPTLVLGALPIAEFGSEEQQEKLLPGVASGETILSAALVESGEHTATATRDDTGWRLGGSLLLVPSAHLAHRVLVPARTEGGVGVFLVDPSTDGVTLESAEMVNREIHSTLRLEGVRVPEAELLGDVRRGEEVAAWMRVRAVLAACAVQLGVADRALEMTAAYTRERQQFDRPIGSFQAVHTRAADAYVDLQAMKLTTWRALHQLERGEDAEDALRVAKYWAAAGGARITYAAQHLHGGMGVDSDYPLHRYYLWATHGTVALGGPNAQLERIGESLTQA